MTKPIISGFILMLHIACISIFCMLDFSYKVEHKAICTLLFYCSSLILPAINNIIIDGEDSAYRMGIYHSHNIFCLVIGTIYALHYTGLLLLDYLSVAIICSCLLTIFIIIFFNLIRYRLIRKNGRH